MDNHLPASAWWDLTTFPLPRESNCMTAVNNVRLAASLILDIEKIDWIICAYGEMTQSTMREVEDGLQLIWADPGKIMKDIEEWSDMVPPPATCMLLSGDKKLLSDALNYLGGKNYNILMAHPSHGDYSDLIPLTHRAWLRESIIDGNDPYHVCTLPHSFKEEDEDAKKAREDKQKEDIKRWCEVMRQDAENRRRKEIQQRSPFHTSVLWDLRTCSVPSESEGQELIDYVRTSIYSIWPDSRISMATYGDVFNLPRSIKVLLDRSTVVMEYTPPDIHLQIMIKRMKQWAKSHPSPCEHFFVISGDKRLIPTLNKLRSQNFTILVAHPQGDYYNDLDATANYSWEFSDFVDQHLPYQTFDYIEEQEEEEGGGGRGGIYLRVCY